MQKAVSTGVFAAAVLAMPFLIGGSLPQEGETRCMAHRRLIQSAKQQWAMDNQMPKNVTLEWEVLIGEGKYLRERPRCPQKGVYTLNSVGGSVICNEHGPLPPVAPKWYSERFRTDYEKRHAVCVANLKQLESAKEQWALDESKKPNAQKDIMDAQPTGRELIGDNAYLRRTPVCPAEGTYNINVVRFMPYCSFHGTIF
ncbi:MAG: hypothetical protein OHK0029_14320 [Armatimonadaceae bacterium]